MAIQKIRLNKPAGKHKAGDTINATAVQIAAAGLKLGDYEPIGTYPHAVPSDLEEFTAPAPEIVAAPESK